jgi:hypothetical protein
MSNLQDAIMREQTECENIYLLAKTRDIALGSDDKRIGFDELRWQEVIKNGFSLNIDAEGFSNTFIDFIKDDEDIKDINIKEFIKKHPISIMFFRLLSKSKSSLFFDCGLRVREVGENKVVSYPYENLFLNRERERFLKLKLTI